MGGWRVSSASSGSVWPRTRGAWAPTASRSLHLRAMRSNSSRPKRRTHFRAPSAFGEQGAPVLGSAQYDSSCSSKTSRLGLQT
jgi:hypothetical protein